MALAKVRARYLFCFLGHARSCIGHLEQELINSGQGLGMVELEQIGES